MFKLPPAAFAVYWNVCWTSKCLASSGPWRVWSACHGHNLRHAVWTPPKECQNQPFWHLVYIWSGVTSLYDLGNRFHVQVFFDQVYLFCWPSWLNKYRFLLLYIYITMQYTLDGTEDIILQFREKGDRRTRRYINAWFVSIVYRLYPYI